MQRLRFQPWVKRGAAGKSARQSKPMPDVALLAGSDSNPTIPAPSSPIRVSSNRPPGAASRSRSRLPNSASFSNVRAPAPNDQPPLGPQCLDLTGDWRLSFVGPAALGADESALPAIAFDDTIHLPATTETAGKGPLNHERRLGGLTPVRGLAQAVWYERDITIPADCSGRRVILFLERTKHCTVWLDGRRIGFSALLCSPQEHDLGPLTNGTHRLTLRIDNSRKPVPGDNHQTSEHTQGNWNGVLGRMELRVAAALAIRHVAVRPDVAGRAFLLRIELSATPAPAATGELVLSAESANHPGSTHRPAPVRIPLTDDSRTIEAKLPLGPEAGLWDEFSPALYRLTVALRHPLGHDTATVVTGLREFGRHGTQFAINGRTTFLRGEVNCCVFPLTGHPPMDVAGWRRYYGTLQQYGINHVRFHSWTPPDAAFTAADELGFYVQTELPFWGEWNDSIRETLQPEGEAILRTYGHHPSFVLLTLGNEHRGERAPMTALVSELRTQDPDRLYAEGANNFLTEPSLAPADDCWITARVPVRRQPGRFANVRGCHATNDLADGHLQVGQGGTRFDYRRAITGIPIPAISHEIGQFTTTPNFDEIARYTGVFAARNLEHFRAKAEAAGVLGRAPTHHRTSAKLVARLYREEIEAALRTPGFAGFQLLGLQDFPGQGTALVGLLDAFMESKGAICPEEFRRFCAPHVLLARFDRHTWTAGKEFAADLELAHFGPADLPAGTLTWELRAKPAPVGACSQAIPSGESAEPCTDRLQAGSYISGAITTPAVANGGLRPLGELRFALPCPDTAQSYALRLVHTAGAVTTTTEHTLWVYPPRPTKSLRPGRGVKLVRHLDRSALEVLAAGGRVVLLPDAAHPFAHSPGGAFMTDFWCWPLFFNTPGTMGLTIDTAHPALRGFPTAEHSDWQWFDLTRAAQPVVLDGLPPSLRPIVEVPDNLDRCHRLGLLLEAQVGSGKLLVCGIDLPLLARRHPEARQLLASLLTNAASDAFQPATTLTSDDLAVALEAKVSLEHAKRSASVARPNRDPFVVFNDHAAPGAVDPDSAWWQIDLAAPAPLAGIELVWDRQLGGYHVAIESTADGAHWQPLLARAEAGPKPRRHHRIPAPASAVRGVRVRVTNLPARAEIALNELRLLQPDA